MREMTRVAVVLALWGAAAFATPMTYEYEGKWGSYGTGDGQFKDPRGICRAANGNIYVADCVNDRIQYFSAEGSFLGKWGTTGTGNGQFGAPADVAIDSSGARVYVVEATNARVQYFTLTGGYLGRWGGSGSGQGQFTQPFAIATAPNGDVYVADTYNHRVQYFSSSGTFRGTWGSRGSGDGQFDQPMGIAVAPDGTVYVAEWQNYRVQYFTASGSFLGKFAPTPQASTSGIDITPNYLVYVAAAGGERNVQIFSSTGSLLAKIGEFGSGEGQFNVPWGVTVDPGTYRTYVGDNQMSTSRVQYFKLANPSVTPASLGRVKALFN